MNKIKLGNDFVLLWQIKRNGELENLLEAVNIRMVRYINAFGFKGEEIPCIPLDNGIVRVEITPEYAPVVGKYFLELHYELTDLSVADKDRKCRVDMEAFRIVPRTSAMTGAYTMSETSDLLIGLRGEKFVFADFTEEELDDLKQGLDNFVAIAEVQEANRESADQARETRTNNAISEIKSDTVEAIGRVDDAISLSDAATLRANTAASDANESEVIRESQEADRQTNTTNAITATNTATTQANTARDGAIIATSDARDAISDTETATRDANIATGKANTATTQANTARDNANASALNADEKATLAETAAQNANNATSDFSDAEVIREQQEEARQTNTATAITNAENATQGAIEATDSLLSNMISLEIRDDLCLYLTTPDNYEGITFEIKNGNLIAII